MPRITRRQLLAAAGGAAALALTGCGDGDDSSGKSLDGKKAGAMDKYGVGDQFKATSPLTFSIMMLSNPAYPYKADWPFFTELTKRTDVKFDATVAPLSDYNQKTSVAVGAGNAPMIIPKTYHPAEEAFIAGGAIIPVSDYVDLMPNFQDKVKKWNLQSNLDGISQQDGKYYILPGLHEQPWVDYSLAVRTDVLDQLNLQVPQTWDDFHNVLKAMKQAHPAADVYPLSDRWSSSTAGASGPGANAFLQSVAMGYGTYAGWSYQHAYWDTNAQKFVYTGAMDQYRQVVEYVATLVREKLMDPESFTQSDDIARQKFANGKSFVISTNASELVNSNRKDIAKIPGAAVVKIPVPIGPVGPVVPGETRLENGIMISKKALNSKNFVAMMQFIDWLWYSDAGQMFAKWGIQGQTYTGSVEDGTFKLSPDVDWAGLNPSAKKKLNVDYGFFNGVFAYGGSTKMLNSQFTDEERKFQEAMNQRKVTPAPPPHPFTAEEREQVTLWEAGLRDHVNQETLKFILGRRPLSEWNQYVSELKAKNSDKYIDLANQAYQRWKKAHG
jgi:putative aldouronate transport system substrate-binding protein